VRRGELRGYTRPSTPEQIRTVVILSSDGINDSRRPWLLGIELRDRDPGDLLAIPVTDQGWAYAGDLSRLYRAWIGRRLGQLDATTVARLDGALRAALDL
jgi:mRNA-degrading endonuclease toxin of MazEF toxin-antitoxin module